MYHYNIVLDILLYTNLRTVLSWMKWISDIFRDERSKIVEHIGQEIEAARSEDAGRTLLSCMVAPLGDGTLLWMKWRWPRVRR
jgi:hypothetical protein